jgi:hypothetical protein
MDSLFKVGRDLRWLATGKIVLGLAVHKAAVAAELIERARELAWNICDVASG